MRDQMSVEHRVRGRTVTIVEHRPPWNAALGPGVDRHSRRFG